MDAGSEKVQGTPLPVIYPLSSGENNEFLSFYAPQPVYQIRNTEAVFLSLPGDLRGLLWRIRQNKVFDDTMISMALDDVRRMVSTNWGNSKEPEKAAEQMLRSVLLVAEQVHANHPHLMGRFGAEEVYLSVRNALDGYYNPEGQHPTVFYDLDTVEKVASAAGIAAFIIQCNDLAEHIEYSMCFDAEGRARSGTKLINKTVDAYVREHPEMGLRIAEVLIERGLGTTDHDFHTVLEFLKETEDAPALGSGWL